MTTPQKKQQAREQKALPSSLPCGRSLAVAPVVCLAVSHAVSLAVSPAGVAPSSLQRAPIQLDVKPTLVNETLKQEVTETITRRYDDNTEEVVQRKVVRQVSLAALEGVPQEPDPSRDANILHDVNIVVSDFKGQVSLQPSYPHR